MRPAKNKENTKMSKSNEELNKVKEDVEAVNEKLQELTPEEIAQVSGGLAHFATAHRCARLDELKDDDN